MNEFTGYFLASLVGISLGLVGSGGSILTVPILVYVFGIEPLIATTYSLFIVGSTALVGGIKNYLNQNVDLKTSLFFGISSVISVLIARKFLMPLMPENIVVIGDFILTKNIFIMILFSIFMIAASYNMIRPISISNSEKSSNFHLFFLGFIVGLLTGILGAGGGFLIIPALILYAHFDMKKAVGTSLLIIAINALIGFSFSMNMSSNFDFKFLFLFTGIAILGMFIGIFLAKKIDGTKLKTGFGWFILVMGIYIIIKELFLK